MMSTETDEESVDVVRVAAPHDGCNDGSMAKKAVKPFAKTRQQLLEQVRAVCAERYRALMGTTWQRSGHQFGELAEWERRYEHIKAVTEAYGRSLSEMKRLSELPGIRFAPEIRAWVNEALDAVPAERPSVPASLRAAIVESLSRFGVPADLEPDGRKKRPMRTRRELRWRGSTRSLTSREMAYVTLLMGLEPGFGQAALPPESIIRQEKKAIDQILARRKDTGDDPKESSKRKLAMKKALDETRRHRRSGDDG